MLNDSRLSHAAKANIIAWLAICCVAIQARGGDPVVQYSTPTAHDHGPLFVDPMEFDPDFQWFKPFDMSTYDYGRQPKLRQGWFFTFDRMWIQVSRPETGGSNGVAGQQLAALNGTPIVPPRRPNPYPVNDRQGIISRLADRGDFTYANRLDLGFMSDRHQGWMISYINIQNPAETLLNNNFQNQEFMQATIGDGDGMNNQDNGNLVYQDLNGQPLGDFEYAINWGDLWSFELTKIYRLEPLHNGFVVEPMFGVRYLNFKDFFFDREAEFDLVNLATVDDMGMITITPTPFLELDTFSGQVINQMLTGQIGVRVHTRRGRWVVGWESRLFGGNNFQAFERTHRDELQDGSGGGDAGTNVDSVIRDQVDIGVEVRREEFELSELVIGTELRVNAAYFVTRDIAVNMGLEVLHIGRGVARGFDLANDEYLTLIGGTVGIVINR